MNLASTRLNTNATMEPVTAVWNPITTWWRWLLQNLAHIMSSWRLPSPTCAIVQRGGWWMVLWMRFTSMGRHLARNFLVCCQLLVLKDTWADILYFPRLCLYWGLRFLAYLNSRNGCWGRLAATKLSSIAEKWDIPKFKEELEWNIIHKFDMILRPPHLNDTSTSFPSVSWP